MKHGAARRRARWALLALALLLVLAAVGAWQALDALGDVPLHISVDGETVVDGWQLGALDGGARLALVIGVALAMLAVLMLVPLLAIAALLSALATVALTLLALLGVLALLVSPLLLIGWLVWRTLRRSPTMPA